MKKIFLFLFLQGICLMIFSQDFVEYKKTIEEVLQSDHRCKVMVDEISMKSDVNILTWGHLLGHAKTPLIVEGDCVCIHYYVEKDTNGSSYYRDLFIPFEYLTEINLEESDVVYYMDRWAGKGSRFDSQGGYFTINTSINKIIKLLRKNEQISVTTVPF